MNLRIIAAVLAAYTVISSSPLLAHEQLGLLTGGEKRAYHACLYASFIHNYCRFHAWGNSEGAFRECVIANGAGRIHIGFPYWGPGITDACRARVLAYH